MHLGELHKNENKKLLFLENVRVYILMVVIHCFKEKNEILIF